MAHGGDGDDLFAIDLTTDGGHTKITDFDASTDTLTLLTGDVLTRAELFEIFTTNAKQSDQHVDFDDGDGHSFALFDIDLDDITVDLFADPMPDDPMGSKTDFADFLELALF